MKPLKVYFIDDEPDLCEIFQDTFSNSSIVITTFSDSKIALKKIRVSPPDLLFVDYRMPGVNGDEVALQLGSTFPIVLITGDLMVETRATFFAKLSKQPYPNLEVGDIMKKLLAKVNSTP